MGLSRFRMAEIQARKPLICILFGYILAPNEKVKNMADTTLLGLLIAQSKIFGGTHQCQTTAFNQPLPIEEISLSATDYLCVVLNEKPLTDSGIETTFVIICGNGRLLLGQSPLPQPFRLLGDQLGKTGAPKSVEWSEHIAQFVGDILNHGANTTMITQKQPGDIIEELDGQGLTFLYQLLQENPERRVELFKSFLILKHFTSARIKSDIINILPNMLTFSKTRAI